MSRILLCDGYFLMHRAAYSPVKGEYAMVYTFFRSFRSLVEKINPDKIILTLEGYPKHRYQILEDYKISRRIGLTPEKIYKAKDFRRQKDICIDILSHHPVSILRHPDYEGDDVIGSIIENRYQNKNDECIVVTGDGDFDQLLNKHDNVKIYNPIKKVFIKKSPYDIILYKSLIGDKSDCIPGIKGVGPKTAEKVLAMPAVDRDAWFSAKPDRRSILERNKRLITFAPVPLDELEESGSSNEMDFEYIKEEFNRMEFKTITSDKSWEKYKSTFAYKS